MDKIEEKRQQVINAVVAATGWTKQRARNQIEAARNMTGCTYNEYLQYSLWKIDKNVLRTMFFVSDSNALRREYSSRVFAQTLFDKVVTNQYFEGLLGRKWCENTSISREDFIAKFAESGKLFYKPCIGHHGDGALPIDITPETAGDVYDKIASMDRGVVEEYLVQHSELTRLSPTAVNTVRLCTVSSNSRLVGDTGKHFAIAYASLKMGGKDSVVDNLVGGGMVAAVDLATGVLVSDAVDHDGNVYDRHPLTDVQIKGFEIPHFKAVREMVESLYNERKFEGYIGWDIAICEDGPAIIEANMQPAALLCTLPNSVAGRGMKPVMERYLETYQRSLAKYAEKIAAESNLSADQVKEKLQWARAQTGISFIDYYKNKCWEMTDAQFLEASPGIFLKLRVNPRIAQLRFEVISSVVSKTGWSRDYARLRIEEARVLTGCMYPEYNKFSLYEEEDDDAIVSRYAEAKQSNTKAQNPEGFDDPALTGLTKPQKECALATAKATGWSLLETVCRIKNTVAFTGCTWPEYQMFHLCDYTPEQIDTILLWKDMEAFRKKFYAPSAVLRLLAQNKVKQHQVFEDYMKRRWLPVKSADEKTLRETFKGCGKLFYKPLGLSRGRGAAAFDVTELGFAKIAEELAKYPGGLVEEFISQHPKMNELCPTCVNTLRVALVSSQSHAVEPGGKKVDVMYAALKMGGLNTVVDNVGQGGYVAGVDMQTGTLATGAVNHAGEVFEQHPVTGATIKGFEIPYFFDALAMAAEICEVTGLEGVIAWDIAITEDGPEIVELNIQPASSLYVQPYILDTKRVLDKYLEVLYKEASVR